MGRKSKIFFYFFVFLTLISTSYLFNSKFNNLRIAKESRGNENKKTYSFRFEKPVIKDSSYYQGYQTVSVKGLSNFAPVGYPELPVKEIKLLIPYGKQIADIKIIEGKKTYFGKYRIEPAQEEIKITPIPVDVPNENTEAKKKLLKQIEKTPPNPKIYKSDSLYPSSLKTEYSIQLKKGYGILVFGIQPVIYKPLSGELYYYDQLSVEIDLKEKETGTESILMLRSNPEDQESVRIIIDNPEELNSYKKKLDSIKKVGKNIPQRLQSLGKYIGTGADQSSLSNDYKYVVITKEFLMGDDNNGFTKLIRLKQAKGIPSVIVTVDRDNGIYNLYPGRDEAEKIRNFIKDIYKYWETEYIVLGGDADIADIGGETEWKIVPARYLHSFNEYVPSDMYYSNLDGNYDFNNDYIFGDYPEDQPDLLSDITVGRIPADSIEEVNNYTNKIVQYEISNDDYLSNVYFSGENLCFRKDDVSCYTYKSLEYLKNSGYYNGYHTFGFNSDPRYYVKTFYDYEYGNFFFFKRASIMLELKDNPAHFIMSEGHATILDSIKEMGRYEFDEVSTAGKPFFYYGAGCYAGSFDNSVDEYTYEISQSDSLLEYMITSEKNAFATVGNSRSSYYRHYSTENGSVRLYRLFWDSYFNGGIDQPAVLNQTSKDRSIFAIMYFNTYRHNAYILNYFGDPGISFKAKNGVPTPTFFPVRDNENIIIDYSSLQDTDSDGVPEIELGKTYELNSRSNGIGFFRQKHRKIGELDWFENYGSELFPGGIIHLYINRYYNSGDGRYEVVFEVTNRECNLGKCEDGNALCRYRCSYDNKLYNNYRCDYTPYEIQGKSCNNQTRIIVDLITSTTPTPTILAPPPADRPTKPPPR